MNRALLIIDMQEGFRHAITERVITPIKRLSDQFDTEHTFHALFTNTPDSQFERQINWHRFHDDTDTAIMHELSAVPCTLYWHTTYNPFTSELQVLLQEQHITQLYICGIYTNVCVTMAAMAAFDADYETFVIADAVSSLQGNSLHDAALRSLGHVLGDHHVITIDTYMQS